jgi:hypothetical protein
VGCNFGCAIIAFDFHQVIDTLLEPERRQFLSGFETADERRSKELIDIGNAVFQLLDLGAAPDDAPISFSDATRRDFDDYAVAVVDGKTLLAGRYFGLDQESKSLQEAYAQISARYGTVTVLWCNDASNTYLISVFQNGTRSRFIATGPGLAENEGSPVDGEKEEPIHGHDRLMNIFQAAIGTSYWQLSDLSMERFSAC